MLKAVLESVSEMLTKSLVTPQPGEVTITYVTCAKSLLDKTIEGMEVHARPMPDPNYAVIVPPNKRKDVPLGGDDIKYSIKQENGILKKICYPDGKELEDVVMVELNGVAYPYNEAVGKPFQTGRVL